MSTEGLEIRTAGGPGLEPDSPAGLGWSSDPAEKPCGRATRQPSRGAGSDRCAPRPRGVGGERSVERFGALSGSERPGPEAMALGPARGEVRKQGDSNPGAEPEFLGPRGGRRSRPGWASIGWDPRSENGVPGPARGHGSGGRYPTPRGRVNDGPGLAAIPPVIGRGSAGSSVGSRATRGAPPGYAGRPVPGGIFGVEARGLGVADAPGATGSAIPWESAGGRVAAGDGIEALDFAEGSRPQEEPGLGIPNSAIAN